MSALTVDIADVSATIRGYEKLRMAYDAQWANLRHATEGRVYYDYEVKYYPPALRAARLLYPLLAEIETAHPWLLAFSSDCEPSRVLDGLPESIDHLYRERGTDEGDLDDIPY